MVYASKYFTVQYKPRCLSRSNTKPLREHHLWIVLLLDRLQARVVLAEHRAHTLACRAFVTIYMEQTKCVSDKDEIYDT